MVLASGLPGSAATIEIELPSHLVESATVPDVLLRLVNVPAAGVVAPIVVPSIAPPLMSTAGAVRVPVNVGLAIGAFAASEVCRASISLLAAAKLVRTLRVVGFPSIGLVVSIVDAISGSFKRV